MAQCQSIFFRASVWLLLYQQVLSVVVLLLPLIWLQQPWYLFVALDLLVDLQEFLYCLDLNRPHIWSFHKIFWPKIENCLDSQTKFEFQFHIWSVWKLVVTSNTGPILMFPWIHPFACEAGSSRGRVYSRQATERNCLKLPVSLVTRYCPTSTIRINPASLQNLLTLLSGESDSIRSMYCCHRIWWFKEFSFCKGTSALISPRTIDWPIRISGSTDPSWWLSNSSQIAATAP